MASGQRQHHFSRNSLEEMSEWIKTVPNDGLILYYMTGNLERVLLTSPKALSDILVHKAYDFRKPDLINNWASRATLDIVGLAGMDHEFEALQNPNNKLNMMYRRFFNSDPDMIRITLLLGLFVVDLKYLQNLPVRRNKIAQESSEFIRSVARQIIHEKREKMEKN
ncbi:hypothetical protein SI65_08584 [Aspergillus cristatus]|uniref:Uncharacterized protein n=1 Tax=Aspergillus cristatus TaxID=573508 RepID=A0A1E3B5A9_ASPCR|nr:hypothetical protein SI65_08584 [Aspergillus cristatus]